MLGFFENKCYFRLVSISNRQVFRDYFRELLKTQNILKKHESRKSIYYYYPFSFDGGLFFKYRLFSIGKNSSTISTYLNKCEWKHKLRSKNHKSLFILSRF